MDRTICAEVKLAERSRLRQLLGSGRSGTGSAAMGPAAVPALVDVGAERHDSETDSDAPDADPELSGTLWGWPDTAAAVQVAGAPLVVPRPAERRCRSALLGRGWERPPSRPSLDRHRGGCSRTAPSSPPLRGSLPASSPLREGQTMSRGAGSGGSCAGMPNSPLPSSQPTGPPPRCGARHPSRRDRCSGSDPRRAGARGVKNIYGRPRDASVLENRFERAVRCCHLSGLFARHCHKPLACMEIRGPSPNHICKLGALCFCLVFPIPSS